METRRSYWVYILASDIGGTLYVGVTNDLDAAEGFTRRYNVHRLVYFEPHDQIEFAIQREKRIKRWNRAWKISLIERDNPHWSDLYPALAG